MRRKHKKLEDYYRLVIKPQMLGQTNLRSVMEWLDHGALPSPITVTPSASDFPRDSSHSLIKYHSHDWFYDQHRYLFRGSQPCFTGNGNLPWNSAVVWCCHPWPSWSVPGWPHLTPVSRVTPEVRGKLFIPTLASLFVEITKKESCSIVQWRSISHLLCSQIVF